MPKDKGRPRDKGRHHQGGFFLVDSLVALGIIGAVFSLLLAGISLAARTTNTVDDRVTASLVASSQAEVIKDAAYQDPPASYPSVTPPVGYSVENLVTPFPGGDSNIQLVTVRVYRDETLVSEVELVKANR